VETFIHQLIAFNKINNYKTFRTKYLLLSGFTLEVVQISPANTACMYISQGSAATEFKCGGIFYFTLFRSLSTNPKVKE